MNKQDRGQFDGNDLSEVDDPKLGRDDAPSTSSDCSIGALARETGVTLRALRFYQSKGLLAPQRNGHARLFSNEDRDRLAVILQGKRLGFTLCEIRAMLAGRAHGNAKALPISRKKCVEQINLLEHQRRDIDAALAELRRIYTGMFISPDIPRLVGVLPAEAV